MQLTAPSNSIRFAMYMSAAPCTFMGMELVSYFLVVAFDLTVDRLRKKHPTKGDKKGPLSLCKASCVIDRVETAPAAVMSQNVVNAYALHDRSLLFTMLGIQTNDWNGEQIKKVLPCPKNIDYMLTLLNSLAILLTRK
jgi:hypothetical protein